MECFEKNMDLLKNKNKFLYKRIKEYHNSEKVVVDLEIEEKNIIAQIKDLDNDLTLQLEKSKQNNYTLKAFKGEKSAYLHSKYAPLKEADRLVDDFGFKETDQVFALGFGLGYHLIDLVAKDKFERMFIIESNLVIFYTALLYIDLSVVLKSEKTVLIVDRKEDIFDILRFYYLVSLANQVKFFEHSPTIRLFNEDYKQVYSEIKNAIEFKNIGMRTDIVVGREWRRNTIFNLPYILEAPKADNFFGEFKGIPAVCVAAGPSLDKNIEKLKLVKNKALLICVGTSLKSLLQKGVEPDIVVSMDGGEVNYKHFKKVDNSRQMFLFSEQANYYLINEEWQGPQVFFSMKRNLSDWVEKMKGEYTSISTGGTVAHSMVDLAYRFGADPIVLVGQDLAYSGEQTHASGTGHKNNKIGNKEKEEMILVEGIYGKEVQTTKELKNFLNYFNNYFAKRSDRLFIDATEGGAKIDHTEIMSLQKVINKYCDEEQKVFSYLQGIYKKAKDEERVNKEDIIREWEKAVEETKEVISLLESKLLKEIENAQTRFSEVDELSNEAITEIEERIKEHHDQIVMKERPKYFTKRTLIVETLKYEQVENQSYENRNEEFKNKLKHYQNYWSSYLEQLKTTLELLQKTEKEIMQF